MTTTQHPNQIAPVSAIDAPPIGLWIGLDWADQKHCLVSRAPDGSNTQLHWVEQKPQKLDEFFLRLAAAHPGKLIGVVLEQRRGPVIYALLKYSFVRLFPVNPRCLSDFRKAMKASGAKGDPSDAHLLSEMGCKHSDMLRPLELNDPATRQLLLLTEQRRGVVDEQTALVNQLIAALKNYYPVMLDLFAEDLGAPISLAFLRRWPTLADAKKAKPAVLRAFFYSQRSRSEEKIKMRIAAIAEATALTNDEALISVMQLQVEALCQRLTATQKSIGLYDERIAQVYATHSKANIFSSFPAAGQALAPRLAAAFGSLEASFPSAHHMQCWSGVAPIKKQSGKTKVVLFRFARPKFLHQTFVEYARVSIQHCAWAQVLVTHLRQKDWTAFRIYRVLAFKWIRIMWRCWKDGVEYNEAKYLAGLQKAGVKLYESLYAASAENGA